MKLNQIVLGEAIATMRQLPAASIDALITDPPYATTALAWDKGIDWEAFWVEAKRVCKPTAITALFSQQPFATDLIVSNRKHFRYEIVWEKPLATGFLGANRRPLRCHELVLVFCEKPGKSIYNPQKTRGEAYTRKGGNDFSAHYNQGRIAMTFNTTGERFPRDVLKFKSVHRSWLKEAIHPTQKPLDLLKWLVLTYSNPGMVVLDPFMGSGTTAISCLETGRNFVGCELSHEYHAQSLQRIEGHAQTINPDMQPAAA